MDLLYCGKHYPSRGQVALYDAQDPAAWPLLHTGKKATVGPKGIVISAIRHDDAEVEIVVYRADIALLDSTLCAAGIIEVGGSGLLVGTEADSDVSRIRWPRGFAPVAVYVDGTAAIISRVTFVLGTSRIPLRPRVKHLPPDIVAAIDTLLNVPHQPHVIDLHPTPYASGGLMWQLPWEQAVNHQTSQPIDRALESVRQILGTRRFFAYKRIDVWRNLHRTESNTIVVCPGRNQYDMLRFEAGFQFDPTLSDTEWYLATLKRFHRAYGINIVGLATRNRVIEFLLQRTLTGTERTTFLDQLLAFCPDITQGFPYSDEDAEGATQDEDASLYDHPYFDIQDRRIALWWD